MSVCVCVCVQMYAIVANTEIVFECLMTKLYLKRRVTPWQVLAVSLVVLGVLLSLWSPSSGQYGASDDDSHDSADLLLGLAVSLASRIASSINTILADK